MTLEEFKNDLVKAAQNGTLLTAKHDPLNLSTTYSSHRTVLSHDLASDLEGFLDSGKYSVNFYHNRNYPNSPYYFEIIPGSDSGFNVPASGVTANSVFATSVVDRIIAVSGQTQGWHLFGEDSSIIQSRVSNGDLIFQKNLS